MTENLNEKISQFIDDELSTKEALNLLKSIHEQPGAIEKVIRYQALSHAINSKSFISIRPDFSARIQAELKNEKIDNKPRFKEQPIVFKYKLMAMAASLAVVTVLVIKNPEDHTPINLQTSQTESEKKLLPPVEKTDPRPLNTQINDYIQAHDNSDFANNDAFITLSSFSRSHE